MTDPVSTPPDRHTRPYRGRFAPSPTGPLHLGSLVAATASYLRARQAQGEWLIRIEDIDPPREMEGAASGCLRTLEQFGFEWDGDITYQSHRYELYQHVRDDLIARNLAYRCRCSRRDIRRVIESTNGIEGIYPGTCLRQKPHDEEAVNWRFPAGSETVSFCDKLQGIHTVRFGRDQGDFVIWRKENLPSYQLAVSVDDIAQGISEVVRGIDLLQETAGQIRLHDSLDARELRQTVGDHQRTGLNSHDQSTQTETLKRDCVDTHQQQTAVEWMHIPVVVDHCNIKLSKQTHASPVSAKNAAHHLCTALTLLGVNFAPDLNRANVQEIWQFAIEHWEPEALKYQQILTLD